MSIGTQQIGALPWGWIETLRLDAVTPAIVDARGGTLVTVTGMIAVGELRAYMGPLGTSADPPCYSPVMGAGGALYRTDADTLLLVTPRVSPGAVQLSIYTGPIPDRIGLLAVQGCYTDAVFSLRRKFSPRMAVGPRALSGEPWQ